VIRLVVGLGNPGPDYAGTRHNLGAESVQRWASARAGRAGRRHRGRWWEVAGFAAPVAALVPHTFMNLSGAAVASARRALALTPEQILVVCDDLDLPLGRLRLRREGSSGGHRGLESVAQALGSEGFARLRLGIGRPAEREPPAVVDYVLSRFSAEEGPRVAWVLERAAEAIDACLREGVEAAMSRVNALAFPETVPHVPRSGRYTPEG
jgi:PTH1 family peptidyl-tRNA hydrolase